MSCNPSTTYSDGKQSKIYCPIQLKIIFPLYLISRLLPVCSVANILKIRHLRMAVQKVHFSKDKPLLATSQKVEEVREIANRRNADVADVVLAWYLTRHSIDVLIPGAKKPEQVTRNLKALEVELTMDEIAEISAIFA